MADVRVTGLPAASSLANEDVLHGVQAAGNQDKKFSLSDLSTFFAGGAPISSVFGRTGAIVATEGDYDIGELGDVDLSVAPTSGQFLKWNGSNWIADNVPADVVDLGYSSASGNGTITNTAGTNATIPGATTLSAGLFSATDKLKLDGIASGAQVNVPTNLTYSTGASTGTVNSSTGTNATIPAATTSTAGLLTSSDKTKLDGIAAGAQVNVATNLAEGTRTSTTVPVTSSTGTSATLSAATASLAGVMTSADKSKLDGIAAGATANVGTVTSVSGTAPISVATGTSTPSISISAATTSAAGSMSAADKSKLDGIAAGAQVNVPTNLAEGTKTTTTVPVTSSTGTSATLTAATTSLAGVMTSADKTKLDGIQAGAQVNVATDLGYTTAASTGTVTSSTGTNATIPAATTSLAGLLTGSDKTKLDGIAAGAEVNVNADWNATSGDALILNKPTIPSGVTNLSYTTAASTGTVNSSTGTNATIPAATTSLAGLLTSADKSKLDGIQAGAQVNVATNLTYTTAATTGTVVSSTGTNATIPAATTSLAGLLTGADKTKLDGIAAGAQTGTVTSVSGTAPIVITGTATTTPTVTVTAASTTASGVVQLSTSTTSTSTTLAATASAVRAVNLANLSLTGGTMTGGVYQTVRTITSATAWDMTTGNLWTFAGGTVANPTNANAGMSGLIYVTAAITGWGTNFDFPGATAVAPTAFPAIIPYYISATNVINIGKPIEGIT